LPGGVKRTFRGVSPNFPLGFYRKEHKGFTTFANTLIPPFRGLAGGKTPKHLANTGENDFPPPPKKMRGLFEKKVREKNRLKAWHSQARGIAPGADWQGFTSPARVESIVKTNLMPFGLRPVGASA
jgi:hypothetical protein